MLEALGGAPAIASLTSLAVEADCTGPTGPFQTTVQSLRPGKVFFAQTHEAGTTRIWSTPASTWTIEAGAQKPVPGGVRDFVRGHEFHLLLLEIESRFPTREAAGEEVVEGRTLTRISMTDEGGHPATLLLDRETFLPRVLELHPPGAQGPIKIYFTDWRRVGDLQYFESFRLTEGPERTFTYRYTRIVPNGVEPNQFVEPPAGPAAPEAPG